MISTGGVDRLEPSHGEIYARGQSPVLGGVIQDSFIDLLEAGDLIGVQVAVVGERRRPHPDRRRIRHRTRPHILTTHMAQYSRMSNHQKWALFNLIALVVLMALVMAACAPTVPDSDIVPASSTSSTVAPTTTLTPVTTTTLGPPTPLVTEDFLRRQNDIAVVGGLWAQVWFEALLGGGLIDRHQSMAAAEPADIAALGS